MTPNGVCSRPYCFTKTSEELCSVCKFCLTAPDSGLQCMCASKGPLVKYGDYEYCCRVCGGKMFKLAPHVRTKPLDIPTKKSNWWD